MARKRIVISIVSLLLVIAAAVFSDRAYRRHSPAAEMENQLRRDIRKGMSRAEVEAYLDRKGIENSYVEKFDKGKSLERTVIARIPDPSTGIRIVKADLQIRFTFDEAGRLSNYAVKEILTGP